MDTWVIDVVQGKCSELHTGSEDLEIRNVTDLLFYHHFHWMTTLSESFLGPGN